MIPVTDWSLFGSNVVFSVSHYLQNRESAQACWCVLAVTMVVCVTCVLMDGKTNTLNKQYQYFYFEKYLNSNTSFGLSRPAHSKF